MFFILFVFLLISEPSWARFSESDADLVDQEARYSLETFNDKSSYQFSEQWLQIYEKSDFAAMISAGSLNATRFDYKEEFKAFSGNEYASFSFRQSRVEDVLQQQTIQELKANVHLSKDTYFSLLGEGGAFKEYGDVGLAIGIGEVKRPKFEFSYWSVDHYYQSKKHDPLDQRIAKSETFILSLNLQLSSKVLFEFDAEYDRPFAWSRPSQGYDYDYMQKKWNTKVIYLFEPEKGFELAFHNETKNEGKQWHLSKFSKAMQRYYHFIESKYYDLLLRQEAGISYHWRQVKYDQKDANLPTEQYPEELNAEKTSHRDVSVYAHQSNQMWNERHFLRSGIYANYVELKNWREKYHTEIKWQTAWEYRYNQRSSFLVNTTWDVDQVVEDLYFAKKRFLPWGGGNLQFLAAF